jgi:endoglucanase
MGVIPGWSWTCTSTSTRIARALGTNTECVTSNIDTAFAPLAEWLRENGRQAFLSETGEGNVANCETHMCRQLKYLNANNGMYMGWTGWAGVYTGYPLSETPTVETDGVWTDTALVTACIAGACVNVTST